MTVDKCGMDDVDVARMQLTDEAMTITVALIGGDGSAGSGDRSAIPASHTPSPLQGSHDGNKRSRYAATQMRELTRLIPFNLSLS